MTDPTSENQEVRSLAAWPPGDGEMARRIRAHDWASTPLGPIAGWPRSLKVVVQLMLDSDIVMAALWGLEGILIYNDAYSRLIGPRSPQALGRPVFEILSELRAGLEPQFAEVRAGKSVNLIDQSYPSVRTTVLEPAWFNVSRNPIREENGEIVAILTILTETTARIEAEQRREAAEAALRESEQRHAFLLKLSDVLRPLSDAVEIQTTVTELVMDFFAADRCYYCEIENNRAIIRRDAARADLPSVAGVYPLDDFPLFQGMMNEGIPLVIQDAQVTDVMDEGLRQLCVQMQIISFINVPVIKNKQYVGNLCLTQRMPRNWADFEIKLAEDIAERTWAAVERARTEEVLSESEQRFRGFFENAAVGAAQIDATGRFIEVNDFFCKLTGYARDELVGKMGPLDLDHPDDIERDRERIAAFFREEAKSLLYEKRYVRKDGQIIWVCVSVAPIRNREGAIKKTAAIIEDITERKLAEAALQHTHDELTRSNATLQAKEIERRALLRQLITAQENERQRISLELHDQTGQQFAVLRLMLATLQEPLQAHPEHHQTLARLQEIVEQLASHTHALARELRPIGLKEWGVVKALAQYVEEWSVNSSVQSDFYCQGKQHPLSAMIEITLYRVVQEALTNILKHAQAHNVSVLLEFFPDHLRAIIEDDGIGFTPEDALNGEPTRLGLRGMRERLALVEGELEIESTPGRGTALYLTLPLTNHTPAEGGV